MARSRKIRSRLVLEEQVHQPDGAGGVRVAWRALGTLWVAIDPVNARLNLVGAQEASRVTHRISLRGAPEASTRRPRATQRFRRGGQLFSILGVAEEAGGSGWLTCWVEEGPLQ